VGSGKEGGGRRGRGKEGGGGKQAWLV